MYPFLGPSYFAFCFVLAYIVFGIVVISHLRLDSFFHSCGTLIFLGKVGSLHSDKDGSQKRSALFLQPLLTDTLLIGGGIACFAMWYITMDQGRAGNYLVAYGTYAKYWNNRITYFESSLFLLAIANLVDWMYHLSGLGPQIKIDFELEEIENKKGGEKKKGGIYNKIKELRGREVYAKTYYHFAITVVIVYFAIFMADMGIGNINMIGTVLPTAYPTYFNVNNWPFAFNVTAGSILCLLLIIDSTAGQRWGRNWRSYVYIPYLTTKVVPTTAGLRDMNTPVARKINRLRDSGAMILKVNDFKISGDLSNLPQSNTPMTLLTSGEQQYNASHPTHALMKWIENKVEQQGSKHGLLASDWAATLVEVPNGEHELVVLSKRDTHDLLSNIPGAELNYAKYGFLGAGHARDGKLAINEDTNWGNYTDIGTGGDKGIDGEESKILKHLQDQQQVYINRNGLSVLNKVWADPISSVRFHRTAMGFSWGNGTFVNIPAWFPWAFSLLELSLMTYVFGDGGYALGFCAISNLLPLYFCLLGFTGQWYQLWIKFKFYTIASISLFQYFYPGWAATPSAVGGTAATNGTYYFMEPGVIYGNLSWQQNTSLHTYDAFDTQITAGFSFATAIFVLVFYGISCMSKASPVELGKMEKKT